MNRDEYQKLRNQEDHYWWFVARRSLAKRLIQRFQASETHVLDVGCGTGAMLECFPGPLRVGLDVASEALAPSHERGLTQLVQANAESIPLQDSCVQTVVTLDCLEHVSQDSRAIEEIFRVLAPGGYAIINVPAFAWLWGPHDVALHHHRRYTQRELRQKLATAGFHVCFSSYSVFFLFPLVIAVRLADRFRRGPAKVKLPRTSKLGNAFLINLMNLEAKAMELLPLPVGSSIVAVAKKP